MTGPGPALHKPVCGPATARSYFRFYVSVRAYISDVFRQRQTQAHILPYYK